jgi:hypothetical protein
MRNALFIVHLVVAVGLVGADLGLLVLGTAGAAGADPVGVYPAAALIASRVIGPLTLLALLSGIVQALARGLLRRRWVLVKLATTAVFTVVAWAVLVPRLAAGSVAATSGAVFTAGDRLPLAIVPAGVTLVLVALVALAVSKPRLARRSRLASGTGAAVTG